MDNPYHPERQARLVRRCGRHDDLLLVDLRISIREKGVFSCFHPDAGDLFNVCSDLKRVCWTLYKPDIRLEKHVSAKSPPECTDLSKT